jgi:hypothetical protein
MESYLSVWKNFRSLSDENDATACHLLTRPLWPRQRRLAICDLGCGDGRLLKTVILQSSTGISTARLVDPDQELLREAERCVAETNLVQRVELIPGTAEELFPQCAEGCDLVLLVHVVYLMRNGCLKDLLRRCPLDIPVYIILDAPDSVFTQLWRNTAPKYHTRALRGHESIQTLPKDRYLVNQSAITSKIRNPMHIDRPELRTAILSMLCYADLLKDASGRINSYVEDTLNTHTAGDFVLCESTCYEIKRVEPSL